MQRAAADEKNGVAGVAAWEMETVVVEDGVDVRYA
jgi:hypothetical protein